MTLVRDTFFNSKLLRWAAWLAASVLPIAGQAQPATFLVGGDNCDFSNIQSAINAAASHPGPDTINVAMNATYTAQALRINAQDLTIIGGFATCASATPTPGAQTTISGAGGAADSVIVITGTGIRTLRGLTITGGDDTDSSRGGGIDFAGGGELAIFDTTLRQNRAGYGGGINFNGTTSVTAILDLGANTLVENNIAANSGGGVRLEGDARLYMLELNSSIRGNIALGQAADTGYGGGLQIVPPANAEIGSSGFGDLGAISTNQAKYGGGIAITARDDDNYRGSALLYTIDPQRPVRIDHNVASVAGGGAYFSINRDFSATEFGYLCAYEFRLDHNQAPKGAAVFLDSQSFLGSAFGALAFLNVADSQTGFLCGVPSLPPRPDATHCAPDVTCNSIDNNRVAQANGQPADGAIMELRESATLRAARVRWTNNTGSDVVHGLTTDQFELDSCLFADNIVSARIIALDGEATINNCTIASNSIGFSDVMSLTGDALIKSSIFWQPGKASLNANHGALDGGNVLSNDPASLPLPTVFNLDPRFIDPARGDYHLRAASPAVDVAVPVVGDDRDLDFLPRDQDLENVNGFGPRDLGAYERPSLQPLVINSNFFTNLALWNEVTPGVTSFDPFENAPGNLGTGAMRFDYQASDIILSRVTARAQCIHLPLTGTYKLNGFARTTGSFPPTSVQTALLRWEFRRDGGEACDNGAADRAGDLRITSGSVWTSATNSAAIVVTPDQFTRNSSVTVYTVMINDGITVRDTLRGWFDRITLTLESDSLFANGFE